LVAIVPTEYTNQVLLPRLKIFSLVSAVGLDQPSAHEEEGAYSVVDDVGLQNGATLTEKCCAKAFAAGEI
jgi:hypothetical protein